VQIGLIGGIGPAATDYYYRRLVAEFARINEPLEMTIAHADAPTLIANLANNNVDEQVNIYDRLTNRLALAGADCVVVTSIAGHFCIDAFRKSSPLAVIDMLMAVDAEVQKRALKRVGILGTRTVMETRFFSGISTAEIIIPSGSALEDVHAAYVSMALSGQVSDEQRAVFDAACNWFTDKAGVDAIMLGGTDLALVYQEGNTRFPLVDCAAIHVDEVVRRATENLSG
jgi:aspartate racemase